MLGCCIAFYDRVEETNGLAVLSLLLLLLYICPDTNDRENQTTAYPRKYMKAAGAISHLYAAYGQSSIRETSTVTPARPKSDHSLL